jgi:hypothetical protein
MFEKSSSTAPRNVAPSFQSEGKESVDSENRPLSVSQGILAVMRDADVRVLLRAHLRELHFGEPDTRIIDELDVCNGAARIDVAVINGKLTGWEIKSPRDNLNRLPGQVDYYSRICDEAWLLSDSTHLEQTGSIVPAWWGLMLLTDTAGEVQLVIQRPPLSNPHVNPLALAQLLWRNEVINLLAEGGVDATSLRRTPRGALWETLISTLTIAELQEAVRNTIKSRQRWRKSANPRATRRTPKWELVVSLKESN